MKRTLEKSWIYRLHERAKDDSGAEMVEYVMMILFVMVAMAGMFSALNNALAGTMEASIQALQGQVNTAQSTLNTARQTASQTIQKANQYRKDIINEPSGGAGAGGK